MCMDVQPVTSANMIGVLLFLLVVLYHYVESSIIRSRTKSDTFSLRLSSFRTWSKLIEVVRGLHPGIHVSYLSQHTKQRCLDFYKH